MMTISMGDVPEVDLSVGPPHRWANYPGWNIPRPQPPGLGKEARRLLQYSRNFAEYATDINQPYFFPTATGPLVDQNGNFVRYEVGINQSFFTYIRHFQYYELIGTQNKHSGTILSFEPENRDQNGHQGPITGVYTNSNNLVNSALESYTQKNFSCILCHVRARPHGVPEKAWEEDYFKTLTFLLQAAHSRFDE